MSGVVVESRSDLQRLIAQGYGPHHVYVLRRADGVSCFGGAGTPFYVGKGQDADRVFGHEKEARDRSLNGRKVNTIREIWAAGQQVLRTIDSFYDSEPWNREEALINEIGCQFDGTGPLTNAQRYDRSDFEDGVQLRKYASAQRAAGGIEAIPANFRLSQIRLMAGPNEPRSKIDVFRKVFATAQANPGMTGEEIVQRLAELDFSGHKSAYTEGGRVCAAWLCGYVWGAYRYKSTGFLQDFVA